MQQVRSTAAVPARDRLAYWREVICATFIQLEVTQVAPGGFSGAIRTSRLGTTQVTRLRTDPMTAERTRRHLRAAEDEYCLLALQLRGRTIGQQDGRHTVLGPGDSALFDSTRPYRVDFRGHDFDHLVVQLPRLALVERGIELDEVTARRLTGGSQLGRLISPFLINMAGLADTTSLATAERLSEMSIELISIGLGSLSTRRQPRTAPVGEELMQRIRLYTQLHLSDPHLTPHKVASANSISVRTLHRMFANEGTTFGHWLREERLRRCFDDLRSPQLSTRSISTIGTRWGLPDAPSLSRAFRARYGLSPREHRQSKPE